MNKNQNLDNNYSKRQGDENMEMTKTDFQALDVNFILVHGRAISSQEVLEDVVPVNWSDDVLNGKYEKKTIIKSKKEEDK